MKSSEAGNCRQGWRDVNNSRTRFEVKKAKVKSQYIIGLLKQEMCHNFGNKSVHTSNLVEIWSTYSSLQYARNVLKQIKVQGHKVNYRSPYACATCPITRNEMTQSWNFMEGRISCWPSGLTSFVIIMWWCIISMKSDTAQWWWWWWWS